MERSVIIYTNNSEKYIEKVLSSVLNQLDTDKMELIIVDDMSTDKTVPIIISLIGYLFTDEEHYKFFINTDVKGRKDSIDMAKSIARGSYKQVITKKRKVKL